MERGHANQPADIIIRADMPYGFTQVPNGLLRNPNLSFKAKGILAVLLSNSDDWKSCVKGLMAISTDGAKSIRSGLRELEEQQYLLRIRYRVPTGNDFVGTVWVVATSPLAFNLAAVKERLDEGDYKYDEEVFRTFPFRASPNRKSPKGTNNNTISKKTTAASRVSAREEAPLGLNGVSTNGFITNTQFERFWRIYPNKSGKGSAITAWEKLVTNKRKRPTWTVIKDAIRQQKETPRWQDPKFIPHASTWLNQSRWLDDPKLMVTYKHQDEEPEKIVDYGESWFKRDDGKYYNRNGEMYIG